MLLTILVVLLLLALLGGGLGAFWLRDWLADRRRNQAPGWGRSGGDLGAVTFYAPISLAWPRRTSTSNC